MINMSLFKSLINPATGNKIATHLAELPPLRNGWIRLVHRTQPGNLNSIVEQGLRGHQTIDGTTSICGDGIGWICRDAEEVTGFGTGRIFIDMPYKEHLKLCREMRRYDDKIVDASLYGATGLIAPNKYIVGAIDMQCVPQEKCIDLIERVAAKNPEVIVEKTDLRMFNLGRPKKLKLTDLGGIERDSYYRYKNLAEQEPRIDISEQELVNMSCIKIPGVRQKYTPAMEKLESRSRDDFLKREEQAANFDEAEFEKYFSSDNTSNVDNIDDPFIDIFS